MKVLILGLRRCSVILTLSAAISFLSVSCAETKFSQCKQIIEITMRIANETKNLSDNGKTKDPQEALQVADAFEEAAEEMKAFEIKDQQLLEYQDGFAKMYVGMSQATRDFVAALDRKDVSAAKSAKKQLQKLGSTERKLVSGMNSYCQEN